MGRNDSTQNTFDQIYKKDLWGLKMDEYTAAKPGMETEDSRNRRLSTLIQDLITLNNVKSVVEFGCGFGWFRYMVDVDLTGVEYDGYDIVDSVIEDNRRTHGRDNVRFHTVRDGVHLPKADLLISKDVLQHLPLAAVQYYLAVFRRNFRFMLIGNDCAPAENVNGEIKPGGYRALRLEQPPFNYPNVVVQQWKCLEFGSLTVKNFCLLHGERQGADTDGVILRDV